MSFLRNEGRDKSFTNRLETARWMDVVTAYALWYNRARLNKEIPAMDIEMFGKDVRCILKLSGFEGRGLDLPRLLGCGKLPGGK